MNSRFAEAVAPRPTRRQFVAAAAAGFTFWRYRPTVYGQEGELVAPNLDAYDKLMADFMRDQRPPGAALAVTYRGHLVYARGFGYADVDMQEPVEPQSLFRIASLSKPFTSAAVLQLVEHGKLKLDDRVVPILHLEPHFRPGTTMDPRWNDITVRHCLQHTAGWDRSKSFDPMSAKTAERVARAFGAPLPINPEQIIRYTMGKPLDFAPGTAFVYSNFGYCVLGRIVEMIAGEPYGDFVIKHILAPLGIRRMQLGKNLREDRAPGEVIYYDSANRTGQAISGPDIGKQSPLPYGVECIETMDANGGWIASAVDLVRFAVALDDPENCRILNKNSIAAMLAPPTEVGGPRPGGAAPPDYYACGWNVRPSARQPSRCTKWHSGLLAGSSTALVCRDDGVDWAVLFNCDADSNGRQFASQLEPLLHKLADEIKAWPEIDLFPDY